VAEGGSLRAQDLRSPEDPTGLSGTIIRIDPETGAAFPGNPLEGSADPNARRIIAYGLRNPFRFAVRPGSGEVWIGDVGHYHWEEIDRIEQPTTSVANFGWPCYEALEHHVGFGAVDLSLCKRLYADRGAVEEPFFVYAQRRPLFEGDDCATNRGSVISGVAFADDRAYPSPYGGGLFFADYDRGCIWLLPVGPSGDPDPAALRTFVNLAATPVDLALGPGDDLYYVDYLGGTIRRIAYTGSPDS
jgi:glucose/arabinose dehydrogenase